MKRGGIKYGFSLLPTFSKYLLAGYVYLEGWRGYKC